MSRKNRLNNLTNSQWLKETKSFWHAEAGKRASEDGSAWTEERRRELAVWLRETYGDEEATRMMDQIVPGAVYSVAPPRDKRKLDHPATFSERDIERLIRLFTKKGQTVLDPFVGTGSTLLACAETGRKGIGIELVDRWVKVCRERIKDTDAGESPRVIHGHAGEELQKMDADSVDFVVTSPPYWSILNKDAGMKVQAERLEKDLETSYSDREDDLGNISDYGTFIARLGEIFQECCRVLKPGQYLACIVSDFRHGPDFYMYHADIAGAIEDAGIPAKGITILLQDSKNLYPFAIPYAFVSNIHHQYILIHQKPKEK
ncbi:MAG: DNA methyltransferase [Armatimonadota bacterium]